MSGEVLLLRPHINHDHRAVGPTSLELIESDSKTLICQRRVVAVPASSAAVFGSGTPTIIH